MASSSADGGGVALSRETAALISLAETVEQHETICVEKTKKENGNNKGVL